MILAKNISNLHQKIIFNRVTIYMCSTIIKKIMANRYHTERITFLVHLEDREKLNRYCEKENKSMAMVLRDFVKSLKVED